MTANNNKGKVYLVGAGPGDPELITVRGAELLRQADCIICDKLANPVLLQFAGPEAEIIDVPKRIGPGSFNQDQINELLVEKAATCKTIVRLKGGDPCIFGRGSEEAAVLVKAQIDFEIVPGITAAIAAGEYSGIMLTDRNYSSQVTFITGQEAAGKTGSNMDWQVLSKFPGTLVFYMAMSNLELITGQLIANGMDEQTPATVISDATSSKQRLVTDKLATICEVCKKKKVGPPAIVVIGTAAKGNDQLNWFMNRPLFGKTIIVTRDHAGNADMAAKINRLGARAIEFNAIKLRPLTNTNSFIEMLEGINQYDWAIFTSQNGVTFFFECLDRLGKDARVFGSAKIAAIGPITANRLADFGIKADFVPDVYTSEKLAKQLIASQNIHNKKVLLLRSQLGSDQLNTILSDAGADIRDEPVYEVIPVQDQCNGLEDAIASGDVDWITFASPSCARSFFEQIPVETVNSSKAKIASVGPVTSQQLKKLGVKVDCQAQIHTIDGLLDIIERTIG